MNSVALPASGESGLVAHAAPADALPLDPALAAAQPDAGVPLAFLQFLHMDAAIPTEASSQSVSDAALPVDAPVHSGEAAPAMADAALEAAPPTHGEAPPSDALTAAMAMPLMPSMMAMPAALPAAARAAAGLQPQASRSAEPAPIGAAGAVELPLAAAAGAAANTAANTAASDVAPAKQLAPTLAVAAAPRAATPTGPEAATRTASGAGFSGTAPAGQPEDIPDTAAAQQVRVAALHQVQQTQQTQQTQQMQQNQPSQPAQPGAAQHATTAAPARDATALQAAEGAAPASSSGFGIAAPATPNGATRDGGTLALSGPPTAWRQHLHEALGERLNLQLGKNAKQAVIRLDPPMLGRIEISIRHAAGSLEVNITATHGEVLRQLNTVSDSLRNDLAQRQYLDVSVNVSQGTPRAQATAQSGAGFGADAQGRGRQQGEDQDERAPGAALAEANQSTTAFSLNGRA